MKKLEQDVGNAFVMGKMRQQRQHDTLGVPVGGNHIEASSKLQPKLVDSYEVSSIILPDDQQRANPERDSRSYTLFPPTRPSNAAFRFEDIEFK